MPEETQPPKRGPGRPRKVPVAKPLAVDNSPAPADEWKTSPPAPPADERIGQKVADDRWSSISFPDGREYHCENGVIVERVN